MYHLIKDLSAMCSTCWHSGTSKVRGKSYNSISAAISALEDAAHEVRRRVMVPYEDEKIKVNGDIEV